jgi:hypothetical protein
MGARSNQPRCANHWRRKASPPRRTPGLGYSWANRVPAGADKRLLLAADDVRTRFDLPRLADSRLCTSTMKSCRMIGRAATDFAKFEPVDSGLLSGCFSLLETKRSSGSCRRFAPCASISWLSAGCFDALHSLPGYLKGRRRCTWAADPKREAFFLFVLAQPIIAR